MTADERTELNHLRCSINALTAALVALAAAMNIAQRTFAAPEPAWPARGSVTKTA